MAEENCGGCFFSWPQQDSSLLCRRNPPMPVVTKAEDGPKGIVIHTSSVYPPVSAFGWCGRWKQRDPATVTVLQPLSIVPQWPQRDPGDETPA